MSRYYVLGQGFVSPEEERTMEYRDKMLAENRCPNDKSYLVMDSLSSRRCAVCGFTHDVINSTFDINSTYRN